MFKNKKRTFIGVDIGDNYLKLSVLDKIEEKIIVQAHNIIDIKNLIIDGRISNPKEIRKYIKNFITSHMVNNPRLIFSLPNRKMEYNDVPQIFTMPKLNNKSEQINAIKLEMEERFPNLDGYISFNQTIHETENDIIVYATLVDKNVLEDYKAIMKDYNVEYLIVPNDITMCNAFVDNNSDDVDVVVDIGYSSTNIIVIQEGKPLYVKTINIAGNSITNIISSYRGLSYLEAEELKVTTGKIVPGYDYSVDEETNELSNIIKTQLSLISTEIRKVQGYIKNEYDLEIDQVHLTGGTSNLDGICQYFREETGLSIKKLLPTFIDELNAEGIIEHVSFINNSLCLSSMCFYEPKIDLEIVKIKVDYMPYIKKGFIITGSLLIILNIVLGAFYIYKNAQFKKVSKEKSILTQEFNELEKESKELKRELEEIISGANSKQSVAQDIQTLLDTKIEHMDILKEIRNATPAYAMYNDIKFINDKVEINGEANDYMTLGQLIKELESISSLSDVEFTYKENDKVDKYYTDRVFKTVSFNIKATITEKGIIN